MNPMKMNLLRRAACAAVAIGAAGAAHADSFAQSILVIDNFRLLHANGTSYSAADFPQLAGAANAFASGQLNGAYSNAAQGVDHAGIGADVAHQNAGAGLAARPENDFTRSAAAPDASYGYGDQRLAGSIVTGAGAPLQSQTRADAALAAAGSASGVGGLAASSAFSFSLGAGEYMTIAFDATPFTQAYADRGRGAGAQANLAWSVSVLNLTTGATVFSFAPAQLNAMSQVGRGDGAGTAAVYDPGRLSFAATTGMLSAGDTYQLTFAQTSFASARQAQAVPEPATLAAFGAALLALAALGRRRPGTGK